MGYPPPCYIHYQCPCRDKDDTATDFKDLPQDAEEMDALMSRIDRGELIPPSEEQLLGWKGEDIFHGYPLSQLLFCEDCHAMKCKRCIQEDIVSYFCPNCLFEVPTASVKAEKNRCMRNCFSCPYCTSTLSVVSEENIVASASGQISTIPTGRYYLHCPTCRFDSREDLKMTFERPTGLASLIQKADDQRVDAREFDQVKDYLERWIRRQQQPGAGTMMGGEGYLSTAPPASYKYATAAMTNVSSIGGSMLELEPAAIIGAGGDYRRSRLPMDSEELDSRVVEDLMTLTDSSQISTMEQRLVQLNDQPYHINVLRPERIHLRTKRSKRCRSCRHVLVKPEQKAIMTRFKINVQAMHFIPLITIQQTSDLFENQPSKLILRFTNPLYFPINVNLSCPLSSVRLICSEFNVGDFSDVWDYEEDVSGLGAESATLAAAMRRSNSSNPYGTALKTLPSGIWEQRANTTSIVVEVTPANSIGKEFKIPLLVTYTYFETPDDDDDFSLEAEQEHEDSDASGSVVVVRKNQRSVDGSDHHGPEGERREQRFWVLVGLGVVGKSGLLTSGAEMIGM